MPASQRKTTIASIQQLCTLGWDSHVLMPPLLRLLHGLIPSASNVFFWLDASGEVCDVYDENPQAYALLPLFLSEFVSNREKDVFDGWKASSRFKQTVDQDLIWKVDRNSFMKSCFYNDFMRQINYCWGLHKAIWVENRCQGILQMHRSREAQRFTQADYRQLDNISLFIQHAFINTRMMEPDATEQAFSDQPTDKAIIITDARGQLQHCSEGAERLCFLAAGKSGLHDLSKHRLLPNVILNLVSNLNRIRAGKPANAPSAFIQNRWGRFAINGQLLSENYESDESPMFIIQIERYEPLRLILYEKVDRVGLSQRQSEVGLDICIGKSYADIAEKLGIHESTVVSHKKEIFRKLNIDNRSQLLNTLLLS